MPKQHEPETGYPQKSIHRSNGALGGCAKAAMKAQRAMIAAKQAASRARNSVGSSAVQAIRTTFAGGLPLRAPPEDYSSDSSSDDGTASDGSDNGLRVRPSRARGGRKPKPPSTDLQYCGVRAPCQHCGAMMWPKEGAACCKDGKQVLDEVYNPPLDPAYLRILQQPSFSHDSRLINAALAMGSQCTSPSRAQGGLGFHEQHYAHLSLLGTTYLVLRNPHSGNNSFDNYMLPRDLLLETATQDLGADYAARLLSAREYLQAHHPLASRLRPVAEVPAQRLDFSKVIRLEANSSHSGAMELAHVSSGVVGRGDAANRVLYFDLSKHVYVCACHSLYVC